MKTVHIVKHSEVKVKAFVLSDFLTDVQESKRIELDTKRITKKYVKQLADELGLDYNDKDISFTKKILTAYLNR